MHGTQQAAAATHSPSNGYGIELPRVALVLSVVVVVNALAYWFLGTTRALELVREVFGLTHPRLSDGTVDIPPVRYFLVSFAESPISIGLHYIFMPLVLVASVFQFSSRLRRRHPTVHRWLGRAFFGGVVFGVGGAVHKIFTADLYGGLLSQVQFTGMAVVTLASAGAGGRAALKKDFVAHERWMWRTFFVLLSSAAVSRLGILFVVPAWWSLAGGREEDYSLPYNAVLAASWLFAPMVADFVRLKRKSLQAQVTDPSAFPG